MDQVADVGIERLADLYWRLVQTTISGDDPTDLREQLSAEFARILIVADLLGRENSVQNAERVAGVEFEFDDEVIIPQGAEQFADKRIDSILGKNMIGIAREFRESIPSISRRIMERAQMLGGWARVIWARESQQILRILAPTLMKAVGSGTPLTDFFTSAEHKLARTEFRDLTRARLETIARTNVSTATNTAAWEVKQSEPVINATMFFEYVATDDGRVRPHHWAFDGFIAPSDWPSWSVIVAPNGFNCRCSPFRSIFRREAMSRGLVSKKDGRPLENRYKRTWRRAIAAGLLTGEGHLTGAEVQMIDRQGNKIRDTFPQRGFGT